MNKIFTCSDFHLGHKNVIRYGDRPFKNIQEMHEVLLNNWNNEVTTSDIVYYLGDFAFGRNILYDFLPKLNGRIIFLRGNHDDNSLWKEMKKICPEHTYLDSAYFDFKINNYRITLCHYPMYSWRNSYLSTSFHFHGHIHNHELELQHPRRINVSVEAIGYKPLNIMDKICEINSNGYNI